MKLVVLYSVIELDDPDNWYTSESTTSFHLSEKRAKARAKKQGSGAHIKEVSAFEHEGKFYLNEIEVDTKTEEQLSLFSLRFDT
jgi:aminoglycoside N3'-acetyltransferase